MERGDLARKRGEIDRALAAYREALASDSALADAWFAMGLCSYRVGELRHAHLYLRTAHTLRPRDADILNELGLVEHALGNLSCAQGTFEQAANANPEHPEAWNNLGLTYAAHGRLRQAKRCFLRAVSIRPAFYTALCNLALACQDQEQLDESERHLRAAIAAQPAKHEAWVALGSLLQDQGRLDEALAACQEAVGVSAGVAEARVALAGVRYRLGDFPGAEEEYRRALADDKTHAEAALGLAQLLISTRRFAEGWDLYEARLRARASPARHFPYPSCADTLAGRKVLVYGEQGLGEETLFASCLPDLVRDARSVHYVCNPRLEGLLRRSFPGVEFLSEADAMRASPAEAPRFDCMLPLGSLFRLYRRDRAQFVPHKGYLAADAARVARWRERLAELGARQAIGLAWRGGRASTGRVLRTLEPQDFEALAGLPGTAWVCLQADASPEELERFAAQGTPLVHWPEAHADLEETAALICALQTSVVATSTVVHLAGALGRPVSVLTPFATTWRYMSEGDDVPWYPSARLFRQQRDEHWSEVVTRVAAAWRL
jgi:Tfp pilus assembly protein PilF